VVVDDDLGTGVELPCGEADGHIDVLHGDVVELGEASAGTTDGAEGVGFIEEAVSVLELTYCLSVLCCH
jgi:hypothetical protein